VIEKEELIVGGDDTNHAGQDRIKGELIVTTFSFLHEDSIVKDFPNNKRSQEALEWMKHRKRDYRFTPLVEEKFRHSSRNLALVTPNLINDFLEGGNLYVRTLRIYLDGRLEKGGRERLRRMYEKNPRVGGVIVDNFIKKRVVDGRLVKRPKCPAVVYYADVWGSILLGRTYQRLISDSRLVPMLR
jgi:hypothetical protein